MSECFVWEHIVCAVCISGWQELVVRTVECAVAQLVRQIVAGLYSLIESGSHRTIK